MSGENQQHQQPEIWHVLVCGLPLKGDCFELGEALEIRRLVHPLSVFDLAALGSVGFREWAILEPLAASAQCEIVSPRVEQQASGYDALNKCWLVSALLMLRGFLRHICPAVSAYSWNLIAGHQIQSAPSFRKQLLEEGVDKAVYAPRLQLPAFHGGLLDFHLSMFIPKGQDSKFFDQAESKWIATNFGSFNALAATEERFRFALEASVDWRYAKDPRAAISRLWAGIESLFSISAELVFRLALFASTELAARGSDRLSAYKKIKTLYGIRSKAVHGEPMPTEKLIAGMQESFEVLKSLLLHCIQRGKVPAEDDILSELLC